MFRPTCWSPDQSWSLQNHFWESVNHRDHMCARKYDLWVIRVSHKRIVFGTMGDTSIFDAGHNERASWLHAIVSTRRGIGLFLEWREHLCPRRSFCVACFAPPDWPLTKRGVLFDTAVRGSERRNPNIVCESVVVWTLEQSFTSWIEPSSLAVSEITQINTCVSQLVHWQLQRVRVIESALRYYQRSVDSGVAVCETPFEDSRSTVTTNTSDKHAA